MPDTGRAPVAPSASGSAPPLRHASAAARSGAPGRVSSNRSVSGGAYAPTFPAASSSATRTAYSPGPSNAATGTAATARRPDGRSACADVPQRAPSRQTRSRARTSGAACPPGSGSNSRRARAGLHPEPPSSTGAGSAGGVLSTRTTRSADAQLPPASAAAKRSTCTPSAHAARVEPRADGGAGARHPSREVARARVRVHDAPVERDPRDADRRCCRPRRTRRGRRRAATDQPPRPAIPADRRAAGATGRPGTRARCGSPRARGARRAGSAAPRSARAPGPGVSRARAAPRASSAWNELPQPRPHHSQRAYVASWIPACQPGLLVMRASTSSPVIVVPGGASNRIAAVAPRGARPGPTTLRTIIPSLLCGRRRSSAPPGHAV